MKLLTKELIKKFETTGSQEKVPDPIIIAKYFHPASNWTWLVSEYFPDTQVFFGYVIGHDEEWGYFSLDELESFIDRYGLKVERDLYCGYKPLSHHLKTLGIANS